MRLLHYGDIRLLHILIYSLTDTYFLFSTA